MTGTCPPRERPSKARDCSRSPLTAHRSPLAGKPCIALRPGPSGEHIGGARASTGRANQSALLPYSLADALGEMPFTHLDER